MGGAPSSGRSSLPYNIHVLTTKVEQVTEEETGLVEGLKLREVALLEVPPQWLPPSLLREERLQHRTHHVELGAGHSDTSARGCDVEPALWVLVSAKGGIIRPLLPVDPINTYITDSQENSTMCV